MRPLIFLTTLLAVAVAAPVGARTVAGVELEPRYSLDDGTELVLHGAGVRTKYFFDIYVGALYLPEAGQSAETIRGRDQPGRIEMHFVYDGVSRDKIVDAWRSGFEANNPPEVLDTVEGRMARFVELFEPMNEGDSLAMTYRPGAGTRVTIKGEEAGTIDGGVFFRALLAVFVGPEPPDDDLKRGMLGQQ